MQHCFPRSNWDTEKNFIPNGGRMIVPAQALVFWLTSISKDPARPFSAPTTDRQMIYDFDKTRLVSGIPNSVGRLEVNQQRSRLCSSILCRPKRKEFPFVYMEARGYFGHAIQTPGSSQILVPNCYPYLLEPWDLNQNGKIDPGTTGPPSKMSKSMAAETGSRVPIRRSAPIRSRSKSFPPDLMAASAVKDCSNSGARITARTSRCITNHFRPAWVTTPPAAMTIT